MTTLAPARSTSALKPFALDLVATLSAALTLWLCGKGIAAIGATAGLPNACWQLLALRAGVAALVVGGLATLGRDRLWLFGLAYAALLATSHLTLPIFLGATLAGAAGSLLRHVRFGPAITGLAFAVVLGLPGLAKKVGTVPAGEIGLDLAIRVVAATVAVVALGLLVGAFLGRGRVSGGVRSGV